MEPKKATTKVMEDTKVPKQNAAAPTMDKVLSDIVDHNLCVIIGAGDDVEKAQKIFADAKAECKFFEMTTDLALAIKKFSGHEAKINVYLGDTHIAGIVDLKKAYDSGRLR